MNEKKKFRFSGKSFMLTYKDWLRIEEIKLLLKKTKREFKLMIAHETGDERHPYKHTHCLVLLDKRIDTRNKSYFDIPDREHPHLKPVNTPKHFNHLVEEYLVKENCILKELEVDDYTYNKFVYMRQAIQECKTWAEVVNHNSVNISKCLNWAKECFSNKPKVNYSEHIVLRNWQKKVKERLMNQPDRNVLWICPGFNVGKSVLSNWLLDNYNTFFCNGGKNADIAHAFDNQEYAIFDLPKTMKDKDGKEFTPYKMMECFKDGRIFSPKYFSQWKRFKPCKVIVFANFYPNYDSMARDRWVIGEINTGEDDIVFKVVENVERVDEDVILKNDCWIQEFATLPQGDLNIIKGHPPLLVDNSDSEYISDFE